MSIIYLPNTVCYKLLLYKLLFEYDNWQPSVAHYTKSITKDPLTSDYADIDLKYVLISIF